MSIIETETTTEVKKNETAPIIKPNTEINIKG